MGKFISQKTNTMLVLLALAVSTVIVTTAWGTMTFLESQEVHSQGTVITDAAGGSAGPLRKSRTRAPEPSTMALFGSGLFGMILSFIRRTYHIAKRIFDIAISILAVILLSPLFLITALLIKLTSRGPVIFTQIRVGKDGQLFKIYKFRTMRVDAEKETGPVWAVENDPRLIPCGKFMRKAHIDEIPQFFNVLKGEMSFIGPRPERPVFVKQLKEKIPDYEKRLLVKPGITGLAQVWHRYDETLLDVKKKIKYDLLYIKRVCLWTDLRILFRTVRVVFTGEGAR